MMKRFCSLQGAVVRLTQFSAKFLFRCRLIALPFDEKSFIVSLVAALLFDATMIKIRRKMPDVVDSAPAILDVDLAFDADYDARN